MMRRITLCLTALTILVASAAPASAGLTWPEWQKEYREKHSLDLIEVPDIEGMARVSAQAVNADRTQRWLDRAWKANQAMVEKCGEAYVADLKTCQPKPVVTASGPSYSGLGSVNWDGIAACESGGNWAINTGNGYWGGLQFAPGTWFSNGGGPFSGSGPFPYSRGQQIAVAESVLATQGIGAWPYCGRFG